MKRITTCFSVMLVLISIIATAPGVRATSDVARGFEIEFTDCVESIGVGLAPTAIVRALVPAEFQLAGEGQPVTPIVIRTAHCGGIAVGHQKPKAGTIVQIGAIIVPPDFRGDVNIYTLWYYTSEGKLAGSLHSLGVDAQHVQRIEYDFPNAAGVLSPLHVNVPFPGRPTLSLDGTVVRSETPSGSFESIWWVETSRGIIRLDTTVPVIAIGTASLTLTTHDDSLGDLIGGDSTGFPLLEQFNTFNMAHTDVTLTSP